METPCATLDAIGMTIKAKEHFWAHRDGLLSDVRQQSNKGIHVLSQCIFNLSTKSPSPNQGDAEGHALTTLSALP